jgi:MOSC domain-containing protein YiiM
MFRGVLVSIYVAPHQRLPSQPASQVKMVRGRGLEGDRYFLGKGSFSKSPGTGREVTLIEVEAIEALHATGIPLEPGAARRNLVTRGVPLNHLVGRTFLVGDVCLRGIRLCEPCAHLEELTSEGVLQGLIHRGGLRADIIAGGTIRVGDPIVIG